MKVVGLGDNVVDRYLNLHRMFPGGNAVNVAAHFAKLGGESAYMGRVAMDKEGQMILQALNDLHVDTEQCELVEDGTTKCCDVNVYEGERSFVGVELGDAWPGGMELHEADIDYLRGFDLIHSSCNAKMPEQMIKLNICPGLISFDFGEKDKYRVDEYLDMICPVCDLALFSCDYKSLDELKCLAERVYKKGVSLVLLTRGSQPPLLYNGVTYIQGIVEYVDPVDTMGAGDSFLSAFMMSLLKQGWSKGNSLKEEVLLQALHEGSHYAGANCLLEGGFGYRKDY